MRFPQKMPLYFFYTMVQKVKKWPNTQMEGSCLTACVSFTSFAAKIQQLPCYSSLRASRHRRDDWLTYPSLDDLLLASFGGVRKIHGYVIITGNVDLYRLDFLPYLKTIGGRISKASWVVHYKCSSQRLPEHKCTRVGSEPGTNKEQKIAWFTHDWRSHAHKQTTNKQTNKQIYWHAHMHAHHMHTSESARAHTHTHTHARTHAHTHTRTRAHTCTNIQ